MEQTLFRYRCSECDAVFQLEPALMVCPTCAVSQRATEPLRGILEVERSDAPGELPPGWDSIDLLPVERRWFPSIPVGNTPLWRPERLRAKISFPYLYLKDESANPTGSLKDRASFLVAAWARKNDIDRIVLASTGNAGSSMAGVGAAAGLRVRLYLPAAAPEAKLVQAQLYGAELVRVDGTYDTAYDQSLAYVREHGGLSRNTAYNPMTIEGKKTVSIEIVRQLGRVPDVVFVSAGDGVILSGVYRGFEDLMRFGVIDRVPLVVAVQAAGSCAIHRARLAGRFEEPVASDTIADSISVDVPRCGWFALRRLQRHKGTTVVVDDRDILIAQQELARTAGLFSEPAGAAAYAGFLKMRDEIDPDCRVVLLLTGHGLKDVRSAVKGLRDHGKYDD